MKTLTIFCLVLSVAVCHKSALREILKSSKETLKLYSGFKSAQHLQYSGGEDRMRFRLFRKSAEAVATYNEESDDAEFGLNFFSSMTPSEKKQWLGLNATGHHPHAPAPPASALPAAPSKVLWTNTGDVTPVKNQGGCGSCWTFGAVGGIETRYKKATGVLRNFAEQEYLDCVYEGKQDGCNGGWPTDCYGYSKRNGGRLAATASYSYQERDGSCRARSHQDAMVGAKISGFRDVSRGESSMITALAEGSLSVAFEVTDYFGQYTKGIITDRTCTNSINHAVTAVGYTPSFLLVKNSWGAGWGDQGYVKFARGYPSNCGIWDYASYATFSSTGRRDSGSDPATDYRPNENDGPAPMPDPNCRDKASNCNKNNCNGSSFDREYCEMTCGFCEAKECPNGTIKCPDGVCRHEHMC